MPQKTYEGLPENHKMPQNRTLSVFCSKSAHVFFLEMPNFKYARKSWNVSFSNHLTYLNWTDSRAKYILHMFWDISRNHIIWFTTHVLGFLSQYFFYPMKFTITTLNSQAMIARPSFRAYDVITPKRLDIRKYLYSISIPRPFKWPQQNWDLYRKIDFFVRMTLVIFYCWMAYLTLNLIWPHYDP